MTAYKKRLKQRMIFHLVSRILKAQICSNQSLVVLSSKFAYTNSTLKEIALRVISLILDSKDSCR